MTNSSKSNPSAVGSTNSSPATPPGSVPAPIGSGRRIRVWIVEDHQLFRELLGDFLGTVPGMEVVGGSSDEAGLMAAVAETKVDVVILDLNLHSVGGMRILESLAKLSTFPAVLILSATVTEHSIQLAMRLGARGYVDKTASLEEVKLAVGRLADGGVYFSETPSRMLGQLLLRAAKEDPNHDLSVRETEILTRLAHGAIVKEVASELNISKWSVYRVRSDLLRKLNARNDQDLFAYAMRIGLIDFTAGSRERAGRTELTPHTP
jgi:DNA-binding NarL/FixJ family response regulator